MPPRLLTCSTHLNLQSLNHAPGDLAQHPLKSAIHQPPPPWLSRSPRLKLQSINHQPQALTQSPLKSAIPQPPPPRRALAQSPALKSAIPQPFPPGLRRRLNLQFLLTTIPPRALAQPRLQSLNHPPRVGAQQPLKSAIPQPSHPGSRAACA